MYPAKQTEDYNSTEEIAILWYLLMKQIACFDL